MQYSFGTAKNRTELVFHTSRILLSELKMRFSFDDARDHGRIVTHLNLNCKNRLRITILIKIFSTQKPLQAYFVHSIIHKLLKYQHQIRTAINVWGSRFLCVMIWICFQDSLSKCLHLIFSSISAWAICIVLNHIWFLARFQMLNARHCLLQIVSCWFEYSKSITHCSWSV